MERNPRDFHEICRGEAKPPWMLFALGLPGRSRACLGSQTSCSISCSALPGELVEYELPPQVDPEARRDVFSHDPGLRCLVDAALMPLDEDLDAPSPPPTPPPEPTEDREGEAEGSRDDDVTVTEQADRRAEGIRGAEAMWTIRMEDPLSRAASAMPGFEDEQQEGLENEASYALKDDLLDIRQQVYSTRWRRKCAVDTLCGLLVRDTEGRVIFSQARGSASLVELHSLQERYVDEIVTHILAALARDNRPRGEGIPLGVVLVAESGQEMVQRLLLKLTADLQADLKRKLHHAVSGPRMGHNPARSCVQPAKAPQQRPPPRQTTPDEGAGDAQPSADSCVEQPHEAPGTPLGPLDVPEDSATEENTDREPSQDSDDAAEDRKLTPGSERGEQDDAEPSSGKSQPGQDEALELLACAVWGTAGAAMRPGMAGFDAQVLALLIKAAYDAVDLQADHGFAMHRVIHCLAGCLYLGAKDPKAAKLLMTMHETGPELDPVAIMQVMAGAALMDGHRSVYKPEGHARIVAAAALASMAVHDNSKPKAMGEKPDMELALSGPYRAALRKAGTISVLLATMKDLPKDSTWQLQLQQVATCCIMYLCTVNSPMDHRELDELVEFSAGPAIWDLPTASYLAAAFWCVVRVPGNLSWLLRDPEERLLRRLVNMINMHRDEIDETIAASIAREALKKQRAEMRAAAERGDLSSWMGGLKGQGSQATLGQRSMRSCATSRSRQVQGWGYASEADSPAMKLPEYAMGTLWIVLYTQLNAVSQVAKANEMYKEDDTSWWGIRMHAETTTAPLTDGQCQSVQAMSELLQITTCNASVVLKTMVVSVLWSLSHLSPRVEDIILDHELGGELMAIVEDLSLSSACQQAAVGFLLLLSNRAETLEQLGGAMKLTQVRSYLALQRPSTSATTDLFGICWDLLGTAACLGSVVLCCDCGVVVGVPTNTFFVAGPVDSSAQ